MDADNLDVLLAELRDDRPAILNIIEGLQHDLEQADLAVTTRYEVEAFLAQYQVLDGTLVNLTSQLSQARVTVLELLAQGYPELPEREIDGMVCDDLDQNLDSIVSARAQFKRRVITTEGTSTVSEEEPIIITTEEGESAFIL